MERQEVDINAKRFVLKANDIVIESRETGSGTEIKINGKVSYAIRSFTYHVEHDQLPTVTMTVELDQLSKEYGELLCPAKADDDQVRALDAEEAARLRSVLDD